MLEQPPWFFPSTPTLARVKFNSQILSAFQLSMEWVRGATVGRGSFATVSLAVVDGALIAAKSASASNSSLLQHEEAILKDLQDCPQIISCFGHDVTTESDGQKLYNLFLEYAPGGSLADLLRGSPLPESAVKRYTRSILQAMRFVHGRGYVHCDVKPQNILVAGDGDVKIADFGLAKRRREKTECPVRGTPLYMSPESVAKKEYEAPMDIWSVGCVVAEMVTGRPAWGRSTSNDDDVWRLMMRIGFGDELPETPAEMSEQGKDFLKRCFIRDPETRWTANMLLRHPFVAGDLEEDGVVGAGECVDSQRMSPRSVFCFSRCDCDESSSSVRCSSGFCGDAGDRIGLLATGQAPDWWWGCESCDHGWMRVRGEESTVPLKRDDEQHWASSSSSLRNSNWAKERIGLLASGELPDWWRSSSLSKDGWISVREAEGLMKRSNRENECHVESEECCKNSILKTYKHWGF